MTELDLSLRLLDSAARGAAVALFVLLAVTLLRERPGWTVARLGAALSVGMGLQLVASAPLFEASVPRLWQAPWVAVAVGNAVLFWLFVQALFDDDFALRPVHALAWALVAGLSGLNCAWLAGSGLAAAPYTLGLQRLAPLLFALLAAWAAALHWRADLVEERRRLRAFILVTGVAYTLAMVWVRLQSPHGQLSASGATVDVLLLLLMAAMLSWHLLRLGGPGFFVPVAVDQGLQPARLAVDAAPTRAAVAARTQPLAAPDPAEDALAQALHGLMTAERAYRDDDLSLATLAARLAVPEYRLRRLINQRLGHRNFNAFVNGFRLGEAQAALADPARRSLPVLTIALDAGFQSVGPFNRAFKAATGLTPSEFRKEKLADS